MEKDKHRRCASCGRVDKEGPERASTVTYLGQEWCRSCASVFEISDGRYGIHVPSPGLMIQGEMKGSLDAWIDCYEQKPKKRILVKDAKVEIQRAWSLWDGDKNSESAMFSFYGWLNSCRPYFLTFRGKGDSWQKVHSWLIQYERDN
jgi:hypothetical protein